MTTNLDRYKIELDSLIQRGEDLHLYLEQVFGSAEKVNQLIAERVQKRISGTKVGPIPSSIDEAYQSWYSEAKALLRQLLPDRISDFVRHYEKPKPRKEITAENYRLEDPLQGISVTRSPNNELVAGPASALPHFRQQLAILKSLKARFESSLFDIRQLVQADLFDSELEAAKELSKYKFTRAGGVLTGVVLERHLRQVCDNHSLKLPKKPVISQLNDLLKNSNAIDVPTWRFIRHLADVRNLCGHGGSDPTAQQVDDLIEGVMRITKTVF
jgi:hypothetical protein